MAQKFPIGIQDFEKLITEHYTYVDKTRYVYNLAKNGTGCFLSRPRRFGKSLLLTTMKAYFLGKKELFKNLAIERLEETEPTEFDGTPWAVHPVIHIDLNIGQYNDEHSLDVVLDNILSKYEAKFGIVPRTKVPALRLDTLIETAHEKTGRKAVLLIDEYDKPLLHVFDQSEVFNKWREILRGFFGIIKSADAHLRFSFLTGITKFSKLSMWSELNSPEDITLLPAYSAICGITREELEANFGDSLDAFAKSEGCVRDDISRELKANYDGYHFSKNSPDVYNPYSLLNSLCSMDYGEYWFASGTPKFLVDQIRAGNFNLKQILNGVNAEPRDFEEYRVGTSNSVPLFFQAGYLTIKGYDKEFNSYHLDFPNKEVKYGFLRFLDDEFLGASDDNPFDVKNFVADLRKNNVPSFMGRVQSIIASLPYPPKKDLAMVEYNFQIAVHLIFATMGAFVQSEVQTFKGRSDSVVMTADAIYIFEFKIIGCPEDALWQINRKDYAEAYKAHKKPIVKIGVRFSAEDRKLMDWKIEA